MQAVEALEVLAGWDPSVHTYQDVLRAERLSVGLSHWPAGQPDTQSPHAEDEVYYVIEGRGSISVAGEARPVRAGSIVYVPAGVEHRFHDIEQDLRVLVFWAPPYSGRRA
ncbi:MAG TPA: cupin domain-containing protein [Candidatus Limnocylindrales bacterium]|nr:cupin domain-containing protein [Candidatus Limnocylindrales bacterium]